MESVLIVAMLANNVPFYNFDLLHEDKIFYERLKYLYNADERLKWFLTFDTGKQKRILSFAKSQEQMDTVLETLDKQKRPKRRFDFFDKNTYYLYYLLLHREVINAISFSIDKDAENVIVDLVRGKVFPIPLLSMDTYFYGLCNPKQHLEHITRDEEFIEFASTAIYSIENPKFVRQSFLSQITDEDVKKIIQRNSVFQTYFQVVAKLKETLKF